MSYITRRPPGPRFLCPDPAHALFCATRRAMNLALMAWLNSHPDPDDVALESDASCSIIRQLVALSRGRAS